MNWPLSRIPSYRWKTLGFSLFSGAIVVLLFVVISQVVPPDTANYNEIVTLLFLVSSVIFLFPARDRLHRLVFGRTESALFSDAHHLDFIARQFTIESLTQEVFPALMQWMGVRAAKLAIADRGRNHFVYYVYSEGQPVRTRQSYYHSLEELLRFARQERRPLAPELPAPEEIRRILSRIRAAYFLPIFYRNRMVGFLILHDPPANKYSDRALETFTGKAAASIQNSLLSARYMDAAAMDREFLVAEKIRKFLQRTEIPVIPGVSITTFAGEGAPVVIEFLRAPDQADVWFAVMFAADRLNGSTAILLSSRLGSLYSLGKKETHLNLHKLLSHFRRSRTDVYERIDLCIVEIRPRENAVLCMLDGPGFRVSDPLQPHKTIVSPGWRNLVDLTDHPSVQIDYGGSPLLLFSKTA